MRQLQERLAEQDRVGTAIVIDVQLARERHAAGSRGDAEIGARHESRGRLEVALRLDGAGNDAVIAERLREENAREAVDVEAVEIAGDLELPHLLNGRGAVEAAAER